MKVQNRTGHLTEQLSELLVVKDLEAAARRNLADGCRVKAVVIVAVATLHEYAAVTEALGKHLTSDVIQVYTCQHR